MRPLHPRKKLTILYAAAASLFVLACIGAAIWYWWPRNDATLPLRYVSTVAGINSKFGEPFGITVKGDDIYVSDGQNGRIWRINANEPAIFAAGLDTPSGIAFDKAGVLIVADSGTHTIRSINAKGEVTTIAGVENRSGSTDGDSATALFNAPIGVA